MPFVGAERQTRKASHGRRRKKRGAGVESEQLQAREEKRHRRAREKAGARSLSEAKRGIIYASFSRSSFPDHATDAEYYHDGATG